MNLAFVLEYIAPRSIHSWSMAHNWIMTCSASYECSKTYKWFWEPFLQSYLDKMYRQWESQGYETEWLRNTMPVWEPEYGLLENVMSYINNNLSFRKSYDGDVLSVKKRFELCVIEYNSIPFIITKLEIINCNMYKTFPCGIKITRDHDNNIIVETAENTVLFMGILLVEARQATGTIYINDPMPGTLTTLDYWFLGDLYEPDPRGGRFVDESLYHNICFYTEGENPTQLKINIYDGTLIRTRLQQLPGL